MAKRWWPVRRDSNGVKPVETGAKFYDEAALVAGQAREPPAQGRRRICMAAQRLLARVFVQRDRRSNGSTPSQNARGRRSLPTSQTRFTLRGMPAYRIAVPLEKQNKTCHQIHALNHKKSPPALCGRFPRLSSYRTNAKPKSNCIDSN